MSDRNLSYQDAMARIEIILQRIDNTDVGLDEIASQVEEATELLKSCKRILTETGKSVQGALDSLDSEFKEKEI
jgi:exodeoxyribonuclease VII small subunit